MRYGVIRVSPALPPLEEQRLLIETAGCNVILEERSQALSAQSILLPLLHRLKPGDEVFVHSLEAFEASVGELARMLHGFNEGGVTLKLLGGPEIESLTPAEPSPRALTLLADYEARHPTRAATRRRARTEPAPLTPHQMRFARDMQRRGHSVRAIGLLFRLSPAEVTAVLGRPDPAPAAPAPGPTDDQPDCR